MRVRGLTLWVLAALLSLIMAAAIVIIWDRSWWTLILFFSWTIIAGTALLLIERRRQGEQCDRLLLQAQASAIRTLSHHRHDWMNELQIVYGYLRLNKPEQAVQIVDRIRGRMEHDSRLSQIGLPELVTYLLSFRTICDTMRLEVDIQEGLYLNQMPYPSDKLTKAVIGLINIIRFRALNPINGDNDNVLKLSIYQTDTGLKLSMCYTGELAAAASVKSDMERSLQGLGELDPPVDELAVGKHDEQMMVIHFPLPA